jgi:hypothetical protein
MIRTAKAKQSISSILEFYNIRKYSNTYSIKPFDEINNRIIFLSKLPFLGRKTKKNNIRILIKSHYSIYYEIFPHEILILFIWDNIQNPEGLKIKQLTPPKRKSRHHQSKDHYKAREF